MEPRCDLHTDVSRNCLSAPIPAWQQSYNQTREAFGCCLRTWIDKLGLRHNYEHWRKRQVNFYVHNGAGGQRRPDAPPPRDMAPDTILNARFAIGRFAHYLAIEKRDLSSLNDTAPRSVLRSPQYRVPRAHSLQQRRANGSLVVLNGWEHAPTLLARIASTLPAGPIALVYGDDDSWTAAQMQRFREAIGASRLVRHFAMNVDTSAAALPHVSQVPIGLNGASVDLPAILASADGALQSRTAHRARTLLCCCQRAWPQRERAFAALRSAGHRHCNLTERRPCAPQTTHGSHAKRVALRFTYAAV